MATQSWGTSPDAWATELQPLVKNWWMMAGRGVLAVLFGVAIRVWRVPVFDSLIVSFGAYAIADGILAIASALQAGRPRMTGWPIALEGIVSVALGSLALARPLVPPLLLMVLVAWGLLTGILEIIAALRLPRQLAAHWLLGTGGVSSIFLAVVVITLGRAASDVVARALGAYAIVFGVVVFLASLRFRRMRSPSA